MSAQVTHIRVNASRKIRLGMGTEAVLGGSIDATADPGLDWEEQFEDLLDHLIKDVDKFADRIEREATTP